MTAGSFGTFLSRRVIDRQRRSCRSRHWCEPSGIRCADTAPQWPGHRQDASFRHRRGCNCIACRQRALYPSSCRESVSRLRKRIAGAEAKLVFLTVNGEPLMGWSPGPTVKAACAAPATARAGSKSMKFNIYDTRELAQTGSDLVSFRWRRELKCAIIARLLRRCCRRHSERPVRTGKAKFSPLGSVAIGNGVGDGR